MTNTDLELRITEFFAIQDEHSKERLTHAFESLTKLVVKECGFPLVDVDEAIQEGVLACFEKLDRYKSFREKDGQSGKALLYMMTCVACHLRQLYR